MIICGSGTSVRVTRRCGRRAEAGRRYVRTGIACAANARQCVCARSNVAIQCCVHFSNRNRLELRQLLRKRACLLRTRANFSRAAKFSPSAITDGARPTAIASVPVDGDSNAFSACFGFNRPLIARRTVIYRAQAGESIAPDDTLSGACAALMNGITSSCINGDQRFRCGQNNGTSAN